MEQKEVKIVTADPSAVGLLGLGMVTLVASGQKFGWTGPGVSLILPWAIFLGAVAQLFAGATDAKKNNLFGTAAFFGYGLFWLGVGMTWLINMGALGPELQAGADPKQLGMAYIGYLIFSVFMTVAATQKSKVLLIDFILIDLLFIGLALSTFDIAYHTTHMLAATAELAIALVSFYGVGAHVINEAFGKVILPQGKPIKF